MKLVTFDDGRVGELRDDTVVELDVPTMREYFERGGDVRPRARSTALADVRLRAPIMPKKFFHTAGNFREHDEESKRVDWSHPIAPWIVFFQNVDAIVGPDEPIVYPEDLTKELDYELELAVVIAKAGKWFGARGGGGLHRRLRDLQRHHRPRHPAPRDAVRRLLVLQGDRHVLPARAVDRHARRDRRPARPARWSCASTARSRQESHSGNMSVTIPEILVALLGARLLGRRRRLDRHRQRRGRLQRGRRVALPQARRRDRGRDREDRRAPQPGRLLAGRPRRAGTAARLLGDLAARRRQARPRPGADGGGRTRRPRRPGAGQRPLPDELLGDEGLRRRGLPARGPAGADHDRALGRRCGRQRLDDGRRPRARVRPRRPASAALAHARGRPGGRRGRTKRSASSSPWAPRPPTGWWASRRPSRKAWFDAFPGPPTPRRSSRARVHSRRSRRSSGCGWPTRSRPRRWSTWPPSSRPGMKESEAAALWEGFVHGEGTGWKGQVELALGFSLVWSGPGIRTFTATGHRPVQEHEPTLFEIWVCADGYWCDHTKNVCPGTLDPRYDELLDVLLDVYGRALDHCRPGASLAELDVYPRRARGGRLPGPAVASDRARRRRTCTRAAVRASGRHGHDRGRNGARDRAGRVLGGRRRPAHRGQLPHHCGRSRETVELPGRLSVR